MSEQQQQQQQVPPQQQQGTPDSDTVGAGGKAAAADTVSTPATTQSAGPAASATAAGNPMKKIYLEKVVINMGMGRSGDAINVAKKALEQITGGRKPCPRNARDSQRDWGVRKGEPIGVSVTVRGAEAKALLKRLLEAKGNTVNARSFDNFGNYSFGIGEHIDIPGVKYEPQIGILGLGVSVALARPGYSIRKRSKHKASIGKTHAITSAESQGFMATEFEVQVA